MNVNYSEYNKDHLPRANSVTSFMHCLHHAMQKTGDYEGAMHQLECIGYSEELIHNAEKLAEVYKETQKKRIAEEQTAHLPQKKYPYVSPDRAERYSNNLEILAALAAHEKRDEFYDRLRDAVEEEMEIDIPKLLYAYAAGDVDAMISALTDWDMEALLAKALIIPDESDYFYSPGEIPSTDIAFPFWGKDRLTVKEFKEYVCINHTTAPEVMRIIDNAVEYAQKTLKTEGERSDCLWSLLRCVVNAPEEVVRMVRL